MIKINGRELEENLHKMILERVSVARKSNANKWNLLYYPLPVGFMNKLKFRYMSLKE